MAAKAKTIIKKHLSKTRYGFGSSSAKSDGGKSATSKGGVSPRSSGSPRGSGGSNATGRPSPRGVTPRGSGGGVGGRSSAVRFGGASPAGPKLTKARSSA